MVNDDVVKCPLCGGFTHIEKPDLLAALKEQRGYEKHAPEFSFLSRRRGRHSAGRDFQKDVHSWNPCVPMWRRSPKE
jgi:hypothetical protein